MNNVLLLSETTLKKYSNLSDNTDGKYIQTAIQATQDIDLQNIIGPALTAKLTDLVSDDTIYDEANKKYYILLADYVTPYMVWQTMSALQVVLNYKIANSGVYQNQDERKTGLSYRETQALQDQYTRYANSYAAKLKNYLCHNSSQYPEYHKVVNGEGEEDVPTYGIFLGDIQSDRHSYCKR